MRKIRWGVLGTAYIFERDTAKGMKLAENCQLYAIAGRSMEKALLFKEKYQFQKAYGTYEELLEDDEVEAVYIALPNDMHYEWTIRALQKKKHVLCEKPLAPTAEEAQEMFREAKKQNVVLMEAFAYQHSPYVKEIRQLIEEGAIGDLCYAEAALITSDYDPSNIRMRKETFGGSTYDIGVYALSFLQRITGLAPSRISAVGIFAENGIDRFTSGILQYEDHPSLRAHFDCGMVLATEKNQALDRFRIYGTKGAILSENFAFNGCGTLTYRLIRGGAAETIGSVCVPNNYCLETEQMGRCITDGEKPYVSGAFSVALAKTVDHVLQKIGY